MNTDFVCKAGVFRHGERPAEIRPVAELAQFQVVLFGIDRLHHGGEPLEIGQAEIREKRHRIHGRESGLYIGVQALGFAGTQNFGVVLVVVVQVPDESLVFLGLLDAYIRKGSVAQVQHRTGAGGLALESVAFCKSIAGAGKLDFPLGLFFQGKAELVTKPLEIFLALFVGILGKAVLGRHFGKLVTVQLV